jgi:hypothetical protein
MRHSIARTGLWLPSISLRTHFPRSPKGVLTGLGIKPVVMSSPPDVFLCDWSVSAGVQHPPTGVRRWLSPIGCWHLPVSEALYGRLSLSILGVFRGSHPQGINNDRNDKQLRTRDSPRHAFFRGSRHSPLAQVPPHAEPVENALGSSSRAPPINPLIASLPWKASRLSSKSPRHPKPLTRL